MSETLDADNPIVIAAKAAMDATSDRGPVSWGAAIAVSSAIQPLIAAHTLDREEGPEPSLAEEISMVLNRHSAENGSNTPDYILAEYLLGALASWEQATKDRDRWYGIKPTPGWDNPTTTTEVSAVH